MTNSSFIHETAVIEENVSIGERSTIWHYCHLRTGSQLGSDVSLGKGVFIDKDVVIGNGSRIQNGVNVYNGVIIDAWVFVGPNVTFTNDKYPRAGSIKWKRSQTYLKPGCSIGAGSVISSEIEIGAFALVGAGSVLMDDVPPFCLAYGTPAKPISRICACGSTRLSFSEDNSNLIQECCSSNLKDEVIKLAYEEIQKL